GPLAAIREQLLLADHAAVLHRQPHQLPARHGAHEHVALPGREGLAGIEAQARRRDGRRPEIDRLFHAGLHGLAVVDEGAGVLAAIADHREAVVAPGLDAVELVAAHRLVLADPKLT